MFEKFDEIIDKIRDSARMLEYISQLVGHFAKAVREIPKYNEK